MPVDVRKRWVPGATASGPERGAGAVLWGAGRTGGAGAFILVDEAGLLVVVVVGSAEASSVLLGLGAGAAGAGVELAGIWNRWPQPGQFLRLPASMLGDSSCFLHCGQR